MLLALSEVTGRVISYQVVQGQVSSQIRVHDRLCHSPGTTARWDKEAWKMFVLS